MAAIGRMMAAAALTCAAMPAGAARQGAIADRSRGTVEITATVAGQAQLSDRSCLWSNTATRLLTLTAGDADRAAVRTVVAAPPPGCTAAEAERDRRFVAALPGASAAGTIAILVSPE